MSNGPEDLPNATTPRMSLTPARLAELEDVALLHGDERVWHHRPEGRHPNVEHTRDRVVEMQRQWQRDGLGYWVARLREPIGDAPTGTFVGVGGCAIESGGWWNLYYRFRPEAQGHGLASELCAAALAAAHAVHAERPVVAGLVEANHASKATAERAGLQLQWRGPDPGHPDAIRLIYADRTLDRDRIEAIVGHA